MGELMIPDELRNVQHIGFGLYGFAPSAFPISELYQWAIDWFARLGCVPDIGNADIGGKNNGNWKLFRGLDRKIRAEKFAGVTSWSLLDIPDNLSGEKYGQLLGEDMRICYYTNQLNKALVFHIREALLCDRPEDFLNVAKQACELVHPQYGVGYRRQFRFGPALYGMGMQHGEGNDPIDDSMDYWRTLRQYEVYALLRDVCPWNFLTQIQLDIAVSNIRLKDWIGTKGNRGRLTPFTDEVTLWTIPNEIVPSVRDELWKAGVILDRKRHFENVMKKYNVDEEAVVQSLKTGVPPIHNPPWPGISAEEMMSGILGAFGGPDSRVFKVEKPGELKEVSPPKRSRKKKD